MIYINSLDNGNHRNDIDEEEWGFRETSGMQGCSVSCPCWESGVRGIKGLVLKGISLLMGIAAYTGWIH